MNFEKTPFLEYLKKVKENPELIFTAIDYFTKKIESEDRVFMAFLPEEKRKERLYAEAELLIEKFKNKELPELFGSFAGVKDIFIVDGFETKAGSKLPPETFIGKEASSVTKLKNAGALIIGKTVTTEFAYFSPGPTRNPANPQHTPGGSSSGSAAAVAAGFCHFALGSQTIGSVSRPAAFCGTIGFKPSYGRIAKDGVIPFSQSADHVGFFVRNISDISIIAKVLSSSWNENRETGFHKRLLIPDAVYLKQADKETLTEFDNAVDSLCKSGYDFEQTDAYSNIEIINTIHKNLVAAEFARTHRDWFRRFGALYSSHSAELISTGEKISEYEIEEAKKMQGMEREKLDAILSGKNADAWISPATATEALKGIESTGSPIMNLPWTFTGLPTIVHPAGNYASGLPFGLQFAGHFMKDEDLIQSSISHMEVLQAISDSFR